MIKAKRHFIRYVSRRIKLYMSLAQLCRLGILPYQLGFYQDFPDMLFYVDISLDDHCITIKVSTSSGLIYFGYLTSIGFI